MKTTSCSEQNQQEDSKRREKAWDENPFHCSAEWHFASMETRFAPTLYSWGRGLSFKTDSFYAAIGNIAKYFGRDRKTVMGALKELVECGWAEVIHKEPGKPVTYRFIAHEEWAQEHPDKCIEKATMPWKDEGDPLGQQLHAISGGLAKFHPNQMAGLRKSGLPDEQIATEWRVFLGSNPQTGRQWKGVYFRFRKHLLRVAADRRDAASAKNSSSGESNRTDTYQSNRTDAPSPTERTPTSPTERTQVFEVSPEAGTNVTTIPALHSQGPLASSSEPDGSYKGGEGPSLKNLPPKKETSLAQAPSRQELSSEEKLERKAYYEDQLAKIEESISDNKNDSKRLKGYHELKVHCERRIAEYSKEEVVTV